MKGIIALAVVGIVSGCTGSLSPSPPGAPETGQGSLEASVAGAEVESLSEEQEIVITRNNRDVTIRMREGTRPGDLPQGCGIRIVGEILLGFVAALNSGNTQGLVAYVDSNIWFGATHYADGVAVHHGVKSRTDLIGYASLRYGKADTLTLEEVHVGRSWDTSRVSLTAFLTRRAEDIATRAVHAKVDIDCDNKRILVWNMVDSNR